MKRILVLVLGLLFTLGLASAASADFAIGGQFEADAYYEDEDGEYGLEIDYIDTWVGLKAAGEFGRATGEINLQLRGGPFGASINGEFMYGVSDTVGLGVVFSENMGVLFYESPVGEIFGNGDWAYYYGEYAKAAVSLGDFGADVLVCFDGDDDDSYYQIIGDLEYGTNGLALYLPIILSHSEYNIDEEWTGLYAALAGQYAISDVLSVAAELYYYDFERKDAGVVVQEQSQTLLGLGVKYATEDWEAKGHFRYDIEAEETFSYGAGLDWFLDDDVTLGVKFDNYTNGGSVFTFSLTVGFGNRDFPPVGMGLA